MRRLPRLTRTQLKGSTLWARLPAELRQSVVASGFRLEHDAAVAAAALMMDLIIGSRPAGRNWNAMDDYDWGNADIDGVGWNVGSPDPHDVVFTTVYSQDWVYGGGTTVAYIASDQGSGIDTKWATAWCHKRRCGRPELNKHENLYDRGELRTAGYKAPSEVEAVLLSSRLIAREMGTPIAWAVFRHRTAAGQGADVALILCPSALAKEVPSMLPAVLPRSRSAR